MLFKQYEAQGLAHYSYLIADQAEALVIDPRRDISVYLADTVQGGYQINTVLETHRNEDYLTGSMEIAAATGAELFHADAQWDYQYGKAVTDGQEWQVGRLKLRAIHTPGHTPGSMSYLLHDPEGHPWIIFTGDTLFSGDIGRMDLMGESNLEEAAGMMYDSLFEKLLPLGDQVIVCPAHGAGSVCGSEIAERTWTTIGLEKKFNPKLQGISRAEFIQRHGKIFERPHYFRQMEVLNLAGPPLLGSLPNLPPLSPPTFRELMPNSQVVDVRNPVCFGGAHLPGSLSIWEDGLTRFAGWFLNYQDPLLFVVDEAKTESVIHAMVRLGFDQLAGYLKGGPAGWSKSGSHLSSLNMLSVDVFGQEIKSKTSKFVLDVRGEDELTGEGLHRAHRINLTQLPNHLDQIPQDKTVYILCSTGNRSTIAASILKQNGWRDVRVLIGGLEAWNNYGSHFDL